MNEDKKKLRIEMKQKRAAISMEERNLMNVQIYSSFISLPEYQNSDVLLIYASFGTEIDTYSIIHNALVSGKHVALPKVLSDGIMEFIYINNIEDLSIGNYGIMEPKCFDAPFLLSFIKQNDKNKKIIMCLPGLAFDLKGSRLGYGKGYYDQYLNTMQQQGIFVFKVGICYEDQVVPYVPAEKHDMALDMILTQDAIYHIEK